MKTWLLDGPDAGDLLHDRALTHGLGVFETMLAIGARLVRPDLHFARMASGCTRLGIAPPDESVVQMAIEEVLREIAAPRARVRVMRTAGAGDLRELAGEAPKTLLSVAGLPPAPESLTVLTSPWPRNETSPVAGVKCSSYAENLVALDHARRAGAEELIFPNTRGMLCEAATANVFVVIAGAVVTPPLASGCLPGTARERLVGLAAGLGVEVVERPVPMGEARAADEVFLTSATRGVVPVSRWDDRVHRSREVAWRLREAFEQSLEIR